MLTSTDASETHEAPPPAEEPRVGPVRILVAEDDPSVRTLLQRCLAHEGYEVITAADGGEAIECVKRCKPDLLLLDVMMPGVNGISVARHLSRHEDTRGIPVVFVTAMGNRYSVAAGINAGARSYVTKPFSIPKLIDKVASIVGGAR